MAEWMPMKTHGKFIYSLILSWAILNACDNNGNDPDFRDQYVGKYQVTEKITCYGPCRTCASLKDTVIIVDYGLTDTTLSVLGRDVFLDSDGFYSAYHYGLWLRNDSIWSYNMNGGLGCGQYENHEGVRISTDPS
jgi:hypothetical protein